MEMKISVIGAGHVGETTALMIAQKELGDIVLMDIIEDMPKGKALDMAEASPVGGFDVKYVGTNEYGPIEGSDIVVMTAGLPRKPGMDRMDLLVKNAKIIQGVAEQIKKLAPNSILLMVANPLDVMAYVAMKVTGFSRDRVFGMAGVLDSTRFRYFIAEALNVSVENTQAMVLGGHGDSMLPLPRYTTVSGVPITQLLNQETIDKIVERTRKGGGEIVSLLKTGSAYYAPAASITQMVESIAKDKKRLLPGSAYLKGEYGLNNVFAGVPIILGANGMEKVVQIELMPDEIEALHKSAAEVKKGMDVYDKGL
ncbi:MAG: malate dehydrogenase [bacterium]